MDTWSTSLHTTLRRRARTWNGPSKATMTEVLPCKSNAAHFVKGATAAGVLRQSRRKSQRSIARTTHTRETMTFRADWLRRTYRTNVTDLVTSSARAPLSHMTLLQPSTDGVEDATLVDTIETCVEDQIVLGGRFLTCSSSVSGAKLLLLEESAGYARLSADWSNDCAVDLRSML